MYMCGEITPSCAKALLSSEPIVSNVFKLWGFVCPMRNIPATSMSPKSKAPEKKETSSLSLAEALDACSVEVLEAVLLILRSRSRAVSSANSQSGNERSGRKRSVG